VRVIQHQLGIAKQTVSRAFDELEAGGRLKRLRGRGYFVTSETNLLRRYQQKSRSGPEFQKGEIPPVVRLTKKGPRRFSLGSVFIDRDCFRWKYLSKCFKSSFKYARALHYMYDNQGLRTTARTYIAKRLKKPGAYPPIPDTSYYNWITGKLRHFRSRSCRRTIATEEPRYGIGKVTI